MMADQVTPPSGMLHSDTLVPGLTPKVGDVTSNFQALYTSLEDYATTINALVSESSSNEQGLDAEQSARADADTDLQAAIDTLESRVDTLDGASVTSVTYGAGDLSLVAADLAYRYIYKTSGGTVTVPSPDDTEMATLGEGQQWVIVNSDPTVTDEITVEVGVSGSSPWLVVVPSRSALYLRHVDGLWVVESAPNSAASVAISATSDRQTDLYRFQPMQYVRTGSTVTTLTLPDRESFYAGHTISVVNNGTNNLTVAARSGDTIYYTAGSDTSITVAAGSTAILVASAAGSWNQLS